MSRIARVGLALLVAVTCMAGEQPHSNIQGHITDSEGAAISNARVLVHWDSSGSNVGLKDNVGISQDVSVRTDAEGHYSISVPPGYYDLFVTNISFTPVAAKVRVKEAYDTTFDAKLASDPLICKELCNGIISPERR